jgi:hypothetical protein
MTGAPAFDIASLHEFYAGDGTIHEVIDRVFARIVAVNDTGILLHLSDRQALLAEAQDLLLEGQSAPPKHDVPPLVDTAIVEMRFVGASDRERTWRANSLPDAARLSGNRKHKPQRVRDVGD